MTYDRGNPATFTLEYKKGVNESKRISSVLNADCIYDENHGYDRYDSSDNKKGLDILENEPEITQMLNSFKLFLTSCGYKQSTIDKIGVMTPDVVAKYRLTEV